jgi:hypothetical protein
VCEASVNSSGWWREDSLKIEKTFHKKAMAAFSEADRFVCYIGRNNANLNG